MHKAIFINVLVLSSILLTACGGAAMQAPSTSSSPVRIAVSTNPDPAVIGDLELVVSIKDADGNPVEGATVDISADHTDMTGMTMSGAATDRRYLCHQCQL